MTRTYLATTLLSTAMAAVLLQANPGHAADRYVGYYYPKPVQIEVYRPRVRTLPNMDRKKRIGFVTTLANHSLALPYPPEYAIFAKGGRADKLILVSTKPNQLNTVFRVRALLATLTSVARTSAALNELGTADLLNFFDLVHMLGFRRVTVSDGESFTHQVDLK